ncbi:MAG: chromosome segregation protein SMC [Coprococcus sp.]|nr:chromosome segregation protein SMC [Coprococcus sp.]
MYLKSIEVHGFKSFAHRTFFEFHNGITGIVGPNGSGKSNVADAVRWVLGEQRAKQLRGGNMQDVIFSGTESRRPLSYASVAITLDNSDHKLSVGFEEVKVTRKLYRSGESEYLINGSVCRLKDIYEMFYDTGIGKEGYSIIGQGQIDQILSGKPEDRRELFDEAAGIVKFKRRKNMSLKKLDEEQQNLLRVNDILGELEKQFGPLKEQAETAREYLKKKEELKRYDINMFLLETARLKEQIQDTEAKLTITQGELDGISRQYDEMKAEYETIEDKVDEIDAEIEKYRRQLSETTLLKQQLEGQIELLKEQINSVRMNDEHYEQRAKTIEIELAERRKQQNTLEKERRDIFEKLSQEEERQKQAQKELLELQSKIAEKSDEIDRNQNEIMELLNNRASTKAKMQHYDTMLDQMQVRRTELDRRMQETEADAEEQKHLYQKHEDELKVISTKIADEVEESGKYEEQIEKLQSVIAEKNEQLRIGQTAFHREESRLESLKNITERYDGYGNSIRRVMEKRGSEPGLLGVVADIIKVEKKYEIAIETALGGSIQNIVTADEETAKKMIAYLKKNKYGRATFLPLTAIRSGQGPSDREVLKEKGVIGTADSLVTVEKRFARLVGHLLGRTIVADTIDTGIALARKYRQTLRIVTLEGELINPGGAMSGGAFKNSSNLLSRRREIEEFEKTVLLLKKDMEEAQERLDEVKAKRSALYAKVEEIQQQLQKDYVTQNTAKMNLDQIAAKQKYAMENAAGIRREKAELEHQIKGVEENQESIQVELETSEHLEKELTKQMELFQRMLEEHRAKEGKEVKKNEEIHLSYAALEQKSAFIEENFCRINEEIAKFTEELNELDISKSETNGEIEQKEKQIAEIRQTIEDSTELFAEIQEEIVKSQKERETLNQKNRSFLRKREEISRQMSDLDKEVFRLSSRKENCEESVEKQINYMWEEYELTYSRALEIRDENLTDLSRMKKRIQELRAEIKSLGAVNVNAIEDFKNLSERYEFLRNQHDDLVEAEGTLKQIIEELDAAMRKQFTEQFALIAEEFNKVFKALFGGGKGTLELTPEEDVLEAGIRIIAQPPGKKLQNMMQLSGGEKALTAISLLFAIQNLKPSPFCLLDEIEAALDDSNVVRFAQYLHRLTKNTQFIVITHRRGTMTAADRLYGITMQEKGISTQVSVDLLEDELDK